MNFNNSNVNNNTKSNSNYVRAVSDFIGEPDFPEVSLSSIIDAELDCRRHKRGTTCEQAYERDAIRNDVQLWNDIRYKRYEIGHSIAFLVKSPVLREVFAGSYRDRVVHHWICLRLNPLFEEFLSERMTSNRKGKGTKRAVDIVTEDIKHVSEDYTKDCYIYKFDLRGFFMSIDKRILNERLQGFIDERYKGDDIKALKWLTEKVIMHCPQNKCLLRSPKVWWKDLPSNKSLFCQDNLHGLAIGNLTSQLFANFYLKEFVDYASERFPHIAQYVDDMVIVCENKRELLSEIPNFRENLRLINVELHPRKFYLQHYTKGVIFVGAIIKPKRRYTSGRMRNKMRRLCRFQKDVDDAVRSCQSYFGLSSHFSSYKIRRRLADDMMDTYSDIQIDDDCLIIKHIKK